MGRPKKENVDRNIILVVNMFSGEYPKKTFAHEIINLYQTDSGKFYIYVPPKGQMNNSDVVKALEHSGSNVKLLMVCHLGGGRYQVLGRAIVDGHVKDSTKSQLLGCTCGSKNKKKSLERRKKLTGEDNPEDKEVMKFGDARLVDILRTAKVDIADDECITFLASSCEYPKKTTYINCLQYGPKELSKKKLLELPKTMSEYPELGMKTQNEANEVNISMLTYKERQGESASKHNGVADSFEVASYILFGRSQTRYLFDPSIYKEPSKIDRQYQPLAYASLSSLFSDEDGWESFSGYKMKSNDSAGKELGGRFLTLIGKDTHELSYSNLFSYFLNESSALREHFVRYLFQHSPKEVATVRSEEELLTDAKRSEVSSDLPVQREVENIDLLIELQGLDLIIENKVCAMLSEPDYTDISSDGAKKIKRYSEHGQLQRYVDAQAEKQQGNAENKKEILTFVICPSWNQVYIDYMNYHLHESAGGIERSVRIDGKHVPVPVLSYNELSENVLKMHKSDFHDESLNARYYEDFLEMLDWLESENPNELNKTIFDVNRERFEQAIEQSPKNNKNSNSDNSPN